MNNCPYNKALWCLRHDQILDLTVQCLKSNGIECLVESPYPGVEPLLQPDLIITNSRRRMITILDIKSPYDNLRNIDAAREANVAYYLLMARNIANHTRIPTKVETMCVCSMGSWDSNNDAVLLDVGLSKAAVAKLAQKCIRKAIAISHKIFRRHTSLDDGG